MERIIDEVVQQWAGVSAFPNTAMLPQNKGLTLRDYFAARVLQSVVMQENLAMLSRDPAYLAEVCAKAYLIADAMLIARVGGQQP